MKMKKESIENLVLRALEKLDDIEKRVEKLERLVTDRYTDQEMDNLIDVLKASVMDRIRLNWDSKAPTEARQLAQLFGRKAAPIGGIDTVFRVMIDEGLIDTVMRLTGARLFVPKGVLEGMTREGLEAIREFGMRELDVRRYREREKAAIQKQLSAELTPEEEAEIERANAEYIRQIEKQKGII